jgi:hypothetical protein
VKTAGFDLQQLVEEYLRSQILRHRQWELVSEQIYSRTMPPVVAPRLSALERRQVTRWIDRQLDSRDLCLHNDLSPPMMRCSPDSNFKIPSGVLRGSISISAVTFRSTR